MFLYIVKHLKTWAEFMDLYLCRLSALSIQRTFSTGWASSPPAARPSELRVAWMRRANEGIYRSHRDLCNQSNFPSQDSWGALSEMFAQSLQLLALNTPVGYELSWHDRIVSTEITSTLHCFYKLKIIRTNVKWMYKVFFYVPLH